MSIDRPALKYVKRLLRPVLSPYWKSFPLGLFGTNQQNPLTGWKFQRPLRIEKTPFEDRPEKADFVASTFGQYLRGDVLDVGCDRCQLRDRLNPSSVDYVGLDRSPPATVCADLERGRLPFRDDAFDVVVCLDVLEHLENVHTALDELIRCSRKLIIVSLPNNWFGYHDVMRLGFGRGRFYGLPPEPPADRHRWFFNFDEADRFLSTKAVDHGLQVIERMALWKIPAWPGWKRPWHALRIRLWHNHYYRNRYYLNVWYVLGKKGET